MSVSLFTPDAPRRHRWRRCLGLVLAGSLMTPWSGGPAAGASAAPRGNEPVVSDITMVQANIKSALSVERFQADVREVLAEEPDFVTYNEVPDRQDSVIAPEGYGVHRSMRTRYTRQSAVAWREDRWTPIDQGTYLISNYRKKPPGRNILLGLRFANWVTLESHDGRRLSVVSVHVAPLDKNMPDLLKPSVRRLRGLVEQLAPAGPVLVGGDFNVHYTSGRYPRTMFDNAQLVPTFDTLASFFPTGDHGGHTIDYVFNRGEGQLVAEQHRPIELNSDHDAVVVGLSWLVDAPADTTRVENQPAGDTESQRRALVALAEQIRATESGSQLEVVTSQLQRRAVFRALRAAAARGVQVRVTTRSGELTGRERRLVQELAATGDQESYVRRCQQSCRAAWRDSGMARSFLLVRGVNGNPTLRLDVNRNLDEAMIERRTTLVLRTGQLGLADGEEQLAALG